MLFNEDGVWEMLESDFSGEGFTDVDATNREQAMLLKFRSDLGIAQSGFCAESEEQTAQNSSCRRDIQNTQWFCHCYAYAFEGDRMAWQEFARGEPRPNVSLPPEADTDGEEAQDDDDDDSGSAVTISELSEVVGQKDTFIFAPLPAGLFGSDGDSHRFIFQRKADSIFDQVLHSDRQTDIADGVERPVCEPCVEGF